MLIRLKFLILFLFVGLSAIRVPAAEQSGLFLSFEQRLALTYALVAQGQPEMEKAAWIQRAKSYFSALVGQPVQKIRVKNFSEFLRLFRGDWPNTHSVELDLNIIERRGVQPRQIFVAESPKVQTQINRYLHWQQEQVKAALEKQAAGQPLNVGKFVRQAMGLLQSQEGRQTLESWLISEGEVLLQEKMKELDHVGEKIAESKLTTQSDPTMRIFLQTMFTEYFSRLSSASKKLIVSSYLGSDLNLPELGKFELMVQNSGPQLQKLLQVVARQADLPPEMLGVFRNLENSVRPVPWVQVEQLLQNEKENYKFLYFERKALGVGTMAQVHRAKIEVHGQRHDVVVRFIKPGISARVEEDKRILTEVASILDNNPEFRKTGTPKLAPVIEDITKTVVAELSQEETVQRQKLGQARYDQKTFLRTPKYKNELVFHVPKIYDAHGSSALMVQEMIIGGKLDKEISLYRDLAPDLKKGIIEGLARLWAREVMFGEGFYHSDLHQGNFMVQVTEQKITVHILDFGMGGQISKELQRQVMVLGAGTELLDSALIGRALWAISDRSGNALTETHFKSMVDAKVAQMKASGETLSMEMWTAWAMDAGLKLPYEFVSLNRGIVIVDKLLADSGSSLTMTKLMKSLAKEFPLKVYKSLVVEEKVSHRNLAKLGWLELQSMLGRETSEPKPTKPAMTVRCEAVFAN